MYKESDGLKSCNFSTPLPPASKTAFIPPPVPAPIIPSPKASLWSNLKPLLVNAVVPVCSTADCKVSVAPSSKAPLAIF